MGGLIVSRTQLGVPVLLRIQNRATTSVIPRIALRLYGSTGYPGCRSSNSLFSRESTIAKNSIKT